jgi:hypothetical protein
MFSPCTCRRNIIKMERMDLHVPPLCWAHFDGPIFANDGRIVEARNALLCCNFRDQDRLASKRACNHLSLFDMKEYNKDGP